MVEPLRLLLICLRDVFRSRAELQLEVIILRHQLNVLRRRKPGRVRLRWSDRALFLCIYRLFASLLASIAIVKPETVIGWHRAGFRAFWRWKSRAAPGRPAIDHELRSLIRQMCRENPLWGAPRIHGELSMLGFCVAQSTVSKYMIRQQSRGPSQGWKAFIQNHAAGIAAIDLLVVPTIAFEQLYVLVVLKVLRREIVRIAVTRHPTADWLARQLTEAFPWDTAPAILIRDNDKAFGHAFQRRIRAMGIRDHPITPESPWQNGYVERVIGSIRRECLDHIVVFGEQHLRRILSEYAKYYNSVRTHLALNKSVSLHRPKSRSGFIQSRPHLGGLHHEYVRI
jgi:transposase InsO family protein